MQRFDTLKRRIKLRCAKNEQNTLGKARTNDVHQVRLAAWNMPIVNVRNREVPVISTCVEEVIWNSNCRVWFVWWAGLHGSTFVCKRTSGPICTVRDHSTWLDMPPGSVHRLVAREVDRVGIPLPPENNDSLFFVVIVHSLVINSLAYLSCESKFVMAVSRVWLLLVINGSGKWSNIIKTSIVQYHMFSRYFAFEASAWI